MIRDTSRLPTRAGQLPERSEVGLGACGFLTHPRPAPGKVYRPYVARIGSGDPERRPRRPRYRVRHKAVPWAPWHRSVEPADGQSLMARDHARQTRPMRGADEAMAIAGIGCGLSHGLSGPVGHARRPSRQWFSSRDACRWRQVQPGTKVRGTGGTGQMGTDFAGAFFLFAEAEILLRLASLTWRN
jgi:hypothetical protein